MNFWKFFLLLFQNFSNENNTTYQTHYFNDIRSEQSTFTVVDICFFLNSHPVAFFYIFVISKYKQYFVQNV